MKMFEVLLSPSTVQSIGWALLHSLWQGFIIALLLSGAMSLMRQSGANFRYITAYLALMLMLILPVLTVWMSGTFVQPVVIIDSTRKSTASPDNTKSVSNTADKINNFQAKETLYSSSYEIKRRLEILLPWFVLIWLFGVFASGLRLSGAWAYTRRLKRKESQKVLEKWQENLERLCEQLEVKKSILLLESSLVRVPTAVGWLKPLILLPPSAVLNLTPQQLEAILAHELAHIRRHDYLANFLQTIVETLLFYHPAAWWISRRIRTERENACDDLAVAASGGNAVAYARALTKMERLRKTAAAPQFAMAADGGGGSLSGRIHRLLKVETTAPNRFAGIWASVLVISALAIIGAGAKASSLVFRAPENAAFDVSKQNELARFTNAQDRAAAICSLGKTRDAAVIPILIQSLGDDEPISSSIGCWDSGDWSPLLQTFKQPTLGEEAALALASMGETAVEPLAAALRDSNPSVRRNAAWAIGEIRDGDKINRDIALEPLVQLLKQDEDAWVRRGAAFALGELKNALSAPALIDSLRDENSGVREMAANALGEMKEATAAESLKIALKDSDNRVRDMARWALDEISDR